MIPHLYLVPALKMSHFANTPTTENIPFPCVRKSACVIHRHAGFVNAEFLEVLTA